MKVKFKNLKRKKVINKKRILNPIEISHKNQKVKN